MAPAWEAFCTASLRLIGDDRTLGRQVQLPARDESLSPETAEWLVGPGVPHVARLAEGPVGLPALQVVESLRAQGLTPSQAAAVMAATAARRRLHDALHLAGWPITAEVMLSTAAFEQASDPRVAWHRAQRFRGAGEVFDLGCGAGLDAVSLALAGASVTGVDLDRARLTLASHNAQAGGVKLDTRHQDVTAVDMPPGAIWHADPGRRNNGRRTSALADSQPPMPDLLGATRHQAAGAVVLSPAVRLDDPDLPEGELEFVQIGGQLTEAVIWLGDLRRAGATSVATRVDVVGGALQVQQLARHGDAPAIGVGPLGRWLLDPAPAAARARVHHQLIAEMGGHRIATTRALCTADSAAQSPWWTSWAVEAELPGRPKAVRTWLRDKEALPMSIQLHGPGQSVAQWWSGIGAVPRGPQGRRVHVVDMPGGVRAIVTRHASLSRVATGG